MCDKEKRRPGKERRFDLRQEMQPLFQLQLKVLNRMPLTDSRNTTSPQGLNGGTPDVVPPKIPKWSIQPTLYDIGAFGGMHCATKYRRAVRQKWRCPSCDRSAYQLIRWTYINGPSWRAQYGDAHGMAWSISIVEHHCHGPGRFPNTILCGDCNAADGAVKRKHKLPPSWSYSAEEIGQFVTVTPYSGKTIIDYAVALRLYAEAHGDLFA